MERKIWGITCLGRIYLKNRRRDSYMGVSNQIKIKRISSQINNNSIQTP